MNKKIKNAVNYLKNKKIKIILLLALSVGFYSCGDDAEDNPTSDFPTEDKISIEQHVEQPGTLCDILEAAGIETYNVHKIKLSGFINGNDVSVIYSMPLEDADLSDVQIVGDGLSTSDNILPSNLFNTKIEQVALPKTIIEIGKEAFEKCNNLTSIVIPNSVTSINDFAFYGCSGLTSIDIQSDNCDVGDYVFKDCSSLISIKGSIGRGIIGSSAFEGCSSLSAINISETVHQISGNAFKDCTSLTSITIPQKVSSLGIRDLNNKLAKNPFSGCTTLKEIHIKGSNPPETASFDTYINITLYVPTGSKEAYKSHSIWGKFHSIIEE